LDGRAVTAEPSWHYPDLARELLRDAEPGAVLDIDTGGELLAALAPPTGRTWAAES
jgi:hypothetical protein